MKVAVVGAGVIGHAVAYELAARGARVGLIDSRGTGAGATMASAGVLAPYIEGHSEALLKLSTCSLGSFDRFIGRVSADCGRTIEYQRSGTLQVACDAAAATQLVTAAGRLATAGVAHEYLDGDAARLLEPSLGDRVVAALRVPTHGYVNVDDLMPALEAASARHGATLSVALVSRIAAVGGGVRITGSETFDADAVVLAAGSWSGLVDLSPASAPPVKPIRGQRLHLQCATRVLSHVVWGTSCYLVPWQDGSILVGATVEDVGFDEHATVEGVRDLLDSAAALVPALAGARFESVRVGLRPLTADGLPVIGASSTMPGIYFATGHYRNGVLLAPLTAALIADLVLEGRERPDLAFVSPGRFGL